MGPHFPGKSAEILVLSSIFGPPGILQRIHRIHYFPPETGHSQQNGPWVPHAGEQDDGSLHKLPQIKSIAHSLRMQTGSNNAPQPAERTLGSRAGGRMTVVYTNSLTLVASIS